MRKIISSIFVLTLVLAAFQPMTAFGIGQMTEPIIIENAKQGEVFEEIIYIFNTEKTENVFKLTAEEDIAGWVKFYDPKDMETQIEKIAISQGSRYDVLARFSIPEGTPNGKYIGAISVVTSSENEKSEEKVSTTVSQEIGREVNITVTDIEKINLKTSIIPNTYNPPKGESLKIRIIYDNQSNIKIRPQIQVKIKKDEKTFHNAIYPFPEELESVNSFSMKEINPIEIQTVGLENGKYLAEMTIIVNEENKYNEKFLFSVGSLVKGESTGLGFVSRIGGGNSALGWLMIGGFLAAVAALGISVNRKKRFFKIKKKKSDCG